MKAIGLLIVSLAISAVAFAQAPDDTAPAAAQPAAADPAGEPAAADPAGEPAAADPAAEPAAAEPAAAAAPAAGGATGPGIDLFTERCASCHSIGKGDRVGPDLKGATDRRDKAWLAKMIKTPSEMLKSDADAKALLKKYNNIQMPDLGLTDAQVSTLIATLEQCSAQPCNFAGSFQAVTKASPADIELGRQLFVGEVRFKNGGPPCVSCHSAAGLKVSIAGGTLAKDLTNVLARLGDEGLDGAIKNPSFPLMKDIFAEQKLEKEEVFALRAFFSASNRSTEHSDSVSVFVAAVVGTGMCLVILNLFWRRRLRGVRKPMVRSEGVAS